ncbi:MAG: succinylglutamate desuccinylase/aspartoacylase family protein [Paracoccaceae bacterium]
MSSPADPAAGAPAAGPIQIPNDYPVELTAPDISRWAEGNAGVPYLWSFEGSAPGLHAMVTALVHGNEISGAIALDRLLEAGIRPARGRLTVGFLNVAAYARFDPADPNATRWVDEDMNRLWAAEVLASDRSSVEMDRVREVQPIVAAADYLLDIHTMQRPAPPVMMAGPLSKGVALSRRIGVPERIVMDQGHAAGTRMRDHGAFADPARANAAALIECGQHWEAAAADLACRATARFLAGLGTVEAAALAPLGGGGPTPAGQELWEVVEAVTIRGASFRFAEAFTGGEVLRAPGSLIGHDIAEDGTETPVVTPAADVMLVMPSMRLWTGQTAVRLAIRRESAG